MRGTPSALARLAVVLAVIGLAVVLGSGPAAAGGPTSVLLASPFTDSAVALYYTDDDYTRLQGLLGGPELPAASSPAPAAAGSPYVTVTWLVHDASPWRIDRVFLVGDETWVVSQVSSGDPLAGAGLYPGETGAPGAVWHTPADPAALIALLSALGLVPGSAGATTRLAATTSAAAVEPAPASQRATAATTGWWLPAIGGLLAGLVIGGGVVRLRSVRRDASGPHPAPAEPAPMWPIR